MISHEFLEQLDNEYDRDHGFVGQVRYGKFDQDALGRLLALLRTIPPVEGEVSARFVTVALVHALGA
jgi:hypothetical protein